MFYHGLFVFKLVRSSEVGELSMSFLRYEDLVLYKFMVKTVDSLKKMGKISYRSNVAVQEWFAIACIS
jgi:hypothetical protein